LSNSASLSGVVLLKEGRYKTRHLGSKSTEQRPTSGITMKTKKPCTHAKQRKKPARNVGQNSASPGAVVWDNDTDHLPKIVRTYTLKRAVIRDRIKAYINQQRGEKHLYFVTVTFPPCVTDDLAYKFFNQWLTVVRTTNRVKSYLWVAERQAIGTLHFHIAIPHRVYVPHVNKAMQIILSNAVRKQQLNWNLNAAKKYNGIDLAKNRKTKRITNFAIKKSGKSLESYLTKYITKNNTKFTHYCWHCSRDFSSLVLKISFTDTELLRTGWEQYLDETYIFESDYCIFIPWVKYPPPQLRAYLSDINNHILTNVINYN
jgi:hypothetical protein